MFNRIFKLCASSFVWLIATVMLVGLLYGCRPNTPLAPNAMPAKAVKVLIDWKAEPTYAGVFIAKELGYFSKRGLDVEIVEGNGATTSAQIIGTGTSYQIGTCSGEATAIARDKGIPIKSIAVFYPNVPTVIYSRGDTPIRRPQDLEGKRIGLIDGSITVDEYRALLAVNKVDRSKVTEISVGWEVAPLLNAQVDGLMNYGELTPVELKLQGHSIETMRFSDFGVRAYSLNLVVNDAWYAQNRETAKAVVEAVNEGYTYVRDEPAKSAEIFSRLFPERNKDFVVESIKVVAAQLGNGPIGSQDTKGWTETIRLLTKLDLIKNELPVTDVAAAEFLNDPNAP